MTIDPTKPYRIVLLTSDKYDWCVKPYAYLLKKYWPGHPPVLVCGYSPPPFKMPNGFTFFSIGDMANYPVQRWSDGLIKVLHTIKDEVVLLMLEDMWINQPVQTEVIEMAYNYMVQFRYVARLDLTGDRLYAGDASFYADLAHVKLIWSNPDGAYHLSMMPAFWRVQHLLRVLIPNETPWDVEIHGTPRLGSLKNEVIVLGTDAWPLHNTLALRGGDSQKLLLDDLDPGDVRDMIRYNLIPPDKLPEEWK